MSSSFSPYGANFMDSPDLQECKFVTSETETASAYLSPNAAVYQKLNDDAMRAMLSRVGHGRDHVGSVLRPIAAITQQPEGGRTNLLYRQSHTASSFALPPRNPGPTHAEHEPDMLYAPTSRMHMRLLRP